MAPTKAIPTKAMLNTSAASGSIDTQAQILIAVYIAVIVYFYKQLKTPMVLISLGVGMLLYALNISASLSISGAIATLGLMLYLMKPEGFNTNTPPSDISRTIGTVKKEYTSSNTIEGYEDVKKEKDEKPAPAPNAKPEKKNSEKNADKHTVPTPFKLGEIPSQVKNGPHIDAASTLVKAINSLNPEQINAMSKDTKQLIDTQKSLMSMLGTMKPMMNDGKELMDTFQQMFGQ